MSIMTKKQQRVYEFIIAFQRTNGYPPSIREICAALGYKSTATVHGHIRRLESIGLLQRNGDNKMRTLTCNRQPSIPKYVEIPQISDVYLNQYVFSTEIREATIAVPNDMVKGAKDMFAFVYHGNSTTECGILPGDKIIVQHAKSIRDGDINEGDIIVALLGTTTIVKRFSQENPAEPNPFHASVKTRILGKVTGVIRLVN
ncbi:hypothetical protein LJB83_02285 [Clostridia bacterium OttesenSCG-928-F22]|nr:hypothetical protein [Clostridia bacterium OttesenSCG-928-F22]